MIHVSILVIYKNGYNVLYKNVYSECKYVSECLSRWQKYTTVKQFITEVLNENTDGSTLKNRRTTMISKRREEQKWCLEKMTYCNVVFFTVKDKVCYYSTLNGCLIMVRWTLVNAG